MQPSSISTAMPASRPPDTDRAETMVRAITYLIAFGVVAGFFWAYREGFYKGRPWPYNTFLYMPQIHFTDLTSLYGPVRAGNPYASSNYPPFSYLLIEPFAWLRGTKATVLWTALIVGGLGTFVAWELKFVRRVDRLAAVVVLTVINYPFLIAFDRGNIEIFVTLALALFAWAWQTNRTELAAVAIGVAAAIKGYPLIFAALFLARGQWRNLAIVAGTALVLTFAGSGFYNFDLPHTLSLMRAQINAYNQVYVIGPWGLPYGCSLFGALKLFATNVMGGGTPTVTYLVPIYQEVTALLGIGLVVALWRLPLRFWEQVALLTFALDALPTVSGGYKLLHLVIPIALFLRFGADDRWRWWYLAGFATLMVPMAYVIIGFEGTNLGVVADPVIMLAMGVAIVVSGRDRRDLAATPPTRSGHLSTA